MALTDNTVWEIRTSGADTNGGGFLSGATGTDRSQQDAAFAVLSAASVIHSTTTQINVSVGDFTVSAADVGNILQITGGTATAGFYQITVIDVPNNRWTLDRSAGTAGQTVVGAMGGALASVSKIGAVAVTRNIIWVKAGTYTITSATINVAGGTFSNSTQIMIEGYNATRGDLGTRPLFLASGIATFTFFSLAGSSATISNIEMDGAGLASSRGTNSVAIVYRCKVSNCTNAAYQGASGNLVIDSIATGCSTQIPFQGGDYINCIAHDNTVTGFSLSAAGHTAIRCISESNSTAGSDGFILSASKAGCYNCVAYNNARDGFRVTGASNALDNNIAESNVGSGFLVNNVDSIFLRNNATYGNSTAFSLGTGKFVSNVNSVAGVTSFFTNAAGQDFTLNNTASAGALARAAGYPGALIIGGTGYLDIGALQHQDTGGAGGEHSAVF